MSDTVVERYAGLTEAMAMATHGLTNRDYAGGRPVVSKKAQADVNSFLDLGRAANWTVLAFGAVQGLASIAVAVGLLFSSAVHNPTTHDGYHFLMTIPGWPESVGLVLLLLGALQIYGTTMNKSVRLRRWVFTVSSAVWSVYAGLYVFGTLSLGGYWRDQPLYVFLSVAAALQSGYAKRAASE